VLLTTNTAQKWSNHYSVNVTAMNSHQDDQSFIPTSHGIQQNTFDCSMW